MSRSLPKVRLVEDVAYAALLAQGFDTVKETFNLGIPQAVQDRLIAAKFECSKCYGAVKGAKMEIEFGGEIFQISAYGAGSASWFLENRDFRILVRSPEMNWPISVEYSSEGLWHIGYEELHRRAVRVLLAELRISNEGIDISDETTWSRLSAVHYAFDIFSRKFTREMTPQIWDRMIVPKGSKKKFEGAGDFIETFTVGPRSSLQVQIYDKGKEIREASGKEWMLRIWEREGYYPPGNDEKIRDVWRVEFRFSSDYLKNRSVLVMSEFIEKMPELLCEALFTRRLTERSTTDENRWRWPMHPVWVLLYKASGSAKEFVAMDRRLTMRGPALYKMMCKQIAGVARSANSLKTGGYHPQDARLIMEAALWEAEQDPEHEMKCRRAYERYRFVDCRFEEVS